MEHASLTGERQTVVEATEPTPGLRAFRQKPNANEARQYWGLPWRLDHHSGLMIAQFESYEDLKTAAAEIGKLADWTRPAEELQAQHGLMWSLALLGARLPGRFCVEAGERTAAMAPTETVMADLSGTAAAEWGTRLRDEGDLHDFLPELTTAATLYYDDGSDAETPSEVREVFRKWPGGVPLPVPPQREKELLDVVPVGFYQGRWIVRETPDSDGNWLVVHERSGEILARVPNFGYGLARLMAESSTAVPELLAALRQARAETTDAQTRARCLEEELAQRESASPGPFPAVGGDE